jgi:uncharacterized DUF497 family protein
MGCYRQESINAPRPQAGNRYTGSVEFEWDPAKATENVRKHRVSFHEAATVFGDFLGATVADPDHSTDECRFITVGLSRRDRLLMVSHADRGGRVRIISARTLTRNERKVYEESQG